VDLWNETGSKLNEDSNYIGIYVHWKYW
jgi:hypothetical protein